MKRCFPDRAGFVMPKFREIPKVFHTLDAYDPFEARKELPQNFYILRQPHSNVILGSMSIVGVKTKKALSMQLGRDSGLHIY